MSDNDAYKVILFYKFIDIEDPELLKKEQKELCAALNLKGRMLIGEEGVNGTFEGKTSDIDTYMVEFKKDLRFSDIVFKESEGSGMGFTKLKIKVRDEIVTLGAGRFDVKNETSKEITADELDALYKTDEDFVVLDLRNDFEVEAGYFDKTVNPKLVNFRDLPEKLSELAPLKKKKIIAVCTGGIRCEKATCLMKRDGFEDIYQLKDGIHTYMAKYPGKNFKGSLYVFDNRLITRVVDTENKEIVGKCFYCREKCEDFYSNDDFTPSHKMICCQICLTIQGAHLRKC